jgi:hypothetical protein
MRMTDTTPAARAVLLELERATTGEQRLLMAFEMSQLARDLAEAGIRHEHPGWTDAQIARELLRFAFLPDPLPSGLP